MRVAIGNSWAAFCLRFGTPYGLGRIQQAFFVEKAVIDMVVSIKLSSAEQQG